MRFAEVVAASDAVAATPARLGKIGHLAGLLARTPPDLIAIVVGFLIGDPRQGRVNVGMALLSSLRDVPPADDATLDVSDVDGAFDRLGTTSGAGSARARAELLREFDAVGQAYSTFTPLSAGQVAEAYVVTAERHYC